jgi:uncharacterized protein YerC
MLANKCMDWMFMSFPVDPRDIFKMAECAVHGNWKGLEESAIESAARKIGEVTMQNTKTIMGMYHDAEHGQWGAFAKTAGHIALNAGAEALSSYTGIPPNLVNGIGKRLLDGKPPVDVNMLKKIGTDLAHGKLDKAAEQFGSKALQFAANTACSYAGGGSKTCQALGEGVGVGIRVAVFCAKNHDAFGAIGKKLSKGNFGGAALDTVKLVGTKVVREVVVLAAKHAGASARAIANINKALDVGEAIYHNIDDIKRVVSAVGKGNVEDAMLLSTKILTKPENVNLIAKNCGISKSTLSRMQKPLKALGNITKNTENLRAVITKVKHRDFTGALAAGAAAVANEDNIELLGNQLHMSKSALAAAKGGARAVAWMAKNPS